MRTDSTGTGAIPALPRPSPLVFARLKVTLIRNGLKGSATRTVSFLFSLAGGTFLGLAGFVNLAIGRFTPERTLNVMIVVFVAVVGGWALFPLLGFGVDETLDPARIATLPLGRRVRMSGLAVASAIGVAPLMTLFALTGTFVPYATSAAAWVLIGGCIVTTWLMCLVVSRALTTALSASLRSRRGRDFATLVFAVLAGAIGVGVQAVSPLIASLGSGAPNSAIDVLGWTPPGALARGIAAAGDGDIGGPLLAIAYGLVTCILLAAGWAAALARVGTDPDRSTEATARRPGRDLIPGLLRWLPDSRALAVASRELRQLWRDPRQRANSVVMTMFGVAAGVVPVILGFWGDDPALVLLAAISVWIVGVQGMNMFGYDADAFWMNIVATGDPGADVTGKGIAAACLGLPILLVATAVSSVVTGGWAYAPVAIATGTGLLMVALGVGSVTSVIAPLPVPGTDGNPFATRNTGQGCMTAITVGISLLLLGVLWVPVAAATYAAWRWAPALLAVVAVASLAYGVGIWWTGRALGGRLLVTHQPEVLRAIGVAALG